MAGYGMSYTVGSTVTQGRALFTARSPRKNGRLVVFLHGAALGAPGDPTVGTYVAGIVPNLIPTLADAGVTSVGIDAGYDAFANDAAMAQIAAEAAAVQAACPWLATDKILFYGISMGAGTAMRYAMLNPSLVAGVYGTAPMCDLNDIYVNNRAGARTEIGTAWGVTYPTALPSGANLPAQASAATAIPCQLDYSTADTTIIPSTVTTLAAAWGAKCTPTVISTSLDHGTALFQATDPVKVLKFMLANGA